MAWPENRNLSQGTGGEHESLGWHSRRTGIFYIAWQENMNLSNCRAGEQEFLTVVWGH
jgi:hypothetical protein